MSTHELFQKHFGNTAAVDMKHPNMESFFEELNAECLAEDKQKNCNIPPVIKSVCDDCTAYPFDERGKTPLCKICKDNPSQTVL